MLRAFHDLVTGENDDAVALNWAICDCCKGCGNFRNG